MEQLNLKLNYNLGLWLQSTLVYRSSCKLVFAGMSSRCNTCACMAAKEW